MHFPGGLQPPVPSPGSLVPICSPFSLLPLRVFLVASTHHAGPAPILPLALDSNPPHLPFYIKSIDLPSCFVPTLRPLPLTHAEISREVSLHWTVA